MSAVLVDRVNVSREIIAVQGDDEVVDFTQLFEKMLSENDGNFPVVMDALIMNKLISSPAGIYNELGFSFITSYCDTSDIETKRKLINNLNYLKMHSCDLNLEMFNFLRSLTFGGKIVKRGKNYINVIKILLPYCTDFFFDMSYWRKIRYFCNDTKEIIEALDFLIQNYGCEKIYKFLPPLPQYNPFSLKHLARNKVRENVWKDKRVNQPMMSMCHEHLPTTVFKYFILMD